MILYHGTFVINSLTHVSGRRRYVTADTSRNSFLLAVITMGEGWHNNHHYYQSTANQGFFWWEIDLQLLRAQGDELGGVGLGSAHAIQENPRQQSHRAPRRRNPGAGSAAGLRAVGCGLTPPPHAMFGRWSSSARPTPSLEGAEEISAIVRGHLAEADDETVRVVTCITGLLGAVAYADRDYSSVEEQRVRQELARIHGMQREGIDAIAEALRRHIIEVSTVQVPRYCRALVELADRELRADVLEVLVEVAAADGVISLAETNLLRQVTTALGLTQDDYNAAQAQHRDKLAVLRGSET